MHILAFAKINLSLDIVGCRADGYHELSTVMHTIDLCDEIKLKKTDSHIDVKTDLYYVAKGKNNIAYKAAEAFLKKAGINSGVSIDIKKNIPVCGGLGGSSADGAAVLKGLNELFDYPLSEDELLSLGACLGADVPFCINKGCALCEGIGERMTPLPTLYDIYAVIIKPDCICSTKKMYEAFDNDPDDIAFYTPQMVDFIKANDTDGVCDSLSNAFYNVAKKMHPEISDCVKALKNLGAKGAMLSGSGSCVYGLFTDDGTAQKAYDTLKTQNMEAYLTKLI